MFPAAITSNISQVYHPAIDLQQGPDFHRLSHGGRITFLKAIYDFTSFSHRLQRYTLGVSGFWQCNGSTKEIRWWLRRTSHISGDQSEYGNETLSAGSTFPCNFLFCGTERFSASFPLTSASWVICADFRLIFKQYHLKRSAATYHMTYLKKSTLVVDPLSTVSACRVMSSASIYHVLETLLIPSV